MLSPIAKFNFKVIALFIILKSANESAQIIDEVFIHIAWITYLKKSKEGKLMQMPVGKHDEKTMFTGFLFNINTLGMSNKITSHSVLLHTEYKILWYRRCSTGKISVAKWTLHVSNPYSFFDSYCCHLSGIFQIH